MNLYPSPFHKIIFAKPNVPKLDFRLILEVNRKILAFKSMGDPGTGLNTRLPEIISLYNPDV